MTPTTLVRAHSQRDGSGLSGDDPVPSKVLTLNYDGLFEAAVEALIHVPFGTSTFGKDITGLFESHVPQAMKSWEAKHRRHEDRVFSTTIGSSGLRRSVIHLPLLRDWEDVPSLQRVFEIFEQLVIEVRAKHIQSLALYGLTVQGLHGSTLVGYLSAAFHRSNILIHVYDQTTPQLV